MFKTLTRWSTTRSWNGYLWSMSLVRKFSDIRVVEREPGHKTWRQSNALARHDPIISKWEKVSIIGLLFLRAFLSTFWVLKDAQNLYIYIWAEMFSSIWAAITRQLRAHLSTCAAQTQPLAPSDVCSTTPTIGPLGQGCGRNLPRSFGWSLDPPNTPGPPLAPKHPKVLPRLWENWVGLQ